MQNCIPKKQKHVDIIFCFSDMLHENNIVIVIVIIIIVIINVGCFNKYGCQRYFSYFLLVHSLFS